MDPTQIVTGVSRVCFPWGSFGMVVDDEDVLMIELEYQLKRVITFDPTVGLHSNVYRVFQMISSLG